MEGTGKNEKEIVESEGRAWNFRDRLIKLQEGR